MKKVITLSLFLALLSGCAFAHSPKKHYDPYEYYEEYHVIYPSYNYIIVIDHLFHSHNGFSVHSHYHYDKYHEHKKKKRFTKIYKKHYKKKVVKGKIKTKKYKKKKHKKKYYHHH
jgi:hypothetical protein